MTVSRPLVEDHNDLNDFLYFAKVAECRGFSAAARALGIPKSRFSRRLAALEARLGVQLLQRSTRQFSLTQAGSQLMQHCVAMLDELETGIAEISELRREPMGKLKIGCTMNASRVFLGSAVTGFLQRYPGVRVEVQVISRDLNLYEGALDVALHVTPSIKEGRYVAKRLWQSPQLLVASPLLLKRHRRISRPEDLAGIPTLDLAGTGRRHSWVLHGPDGTSVEHAHKPHLISDDLEVLHQAALRGAGLIRLPQLVCSTDVQLGALQIVLPKWHMEPRQLYAIFLSRRGLTPAAKRFVDYLDDWFEAQPDWRNHVAAIPVAGAKPGRAARS